MAFFEKLNKVAKVIEEKTNDSMEMSRLTAKAGNAEIGFNKDIQKIGEFYYEFFLAGGTVEPNILATMKSAKNNQDTLAEAKAEMARLEENIEERKAEAKAERIAAREEAKAEREAAKAAAKAEREAAEAVAVEALARETEEAVEETVEEVVEEETEVL
ncbi:MAG: hypothetical protein IKU54_00025 [Oscillospiraceae bacterium]|nr:hypothetical protein [Oscillospiraceae bacterium]